MTKQQWKAIAKEALIRSGSTGVKASGVVSGLTADEQMKAFERLNYLEYQIENGKAD